MFELVYPNVVDNAKRNKARGYYLPKGIIKNYNIIIDWKNFYDQPIDSDIKRYKALRKLTVGQGEDCTTVCLFEYDYIKNHYRFNVVDLRRQKELNADPKVIQ